MLDKYQQCRQVFVPTGYAYRRGPGNPLPERLEDFLLDWPDKGCLFVTRAGGQVGCLKVPHAVGHAWGLRHNGVTQFRGVVDAHGNYTNLVTFGSSCLPLDKFWEALDKPVRLAVLLETYRRDRLQDPGPCVAGVMYGGATLGGAGWLAFAFDVPVRELSKGR